jgi:hypothetical protein
VHMLVALVLDMQAGKLGRDDGDVDTASGPGAALALGAQMRLQLRPLNASSSSAASGPWLPAS